jgi:predicted nucleic acid-binding Zn ribbon protein
MSVKVQWLPSPFANFSAAARCFKALMTAAPRWRRRCQSCQTSVGKIFSGGMTVRLKASGFGVNDDHKARLRASSLP